MADRIHAPARIAIGTVLIIAALATIMLPAAVQARATRTWVSGVGDDANPCVRSAPCRTFPGAINKTAEGGEINALDPGSFGSVTITEAITIDTSATAGAISHGGSNGVTVNAGPDDDVVLRGLDINGTGDCSGITGLSGILLLNGRSLTVEDTPVQRDTTAGLQLTPQASNAKVLLNDVHVSEGCQRGINVAPAAGRTLAVMVRDTTIANTQTALQAGSGAHVGLARSTIFGNATGLLTTGGIIDDLGENQLFGNGVNGTFSNAPRPSSPAGPLPAARLTAPPQTACTVPRLVGLRLSSARAHLKKANCSLGKVKRRNTRQRRRVGRVLAQGTRAGRRLAKDAKVGVTLGRRSTAR